MFGCINPMEDDFGIYLRTRGKEDSSPESASIDIQVQLINLFKFDIFLPNLILC